MRLSLLISLSLLLLSWRNAGAQIAPADDFFDSGAQLYISNNIPAALEKVESGLKFYPDDEKLKKLEQLLKQQQQQSQQNQQQKNQQSKSQQQKSQGQQQNQSSSQKSSESQQQEKQKQAEKEKEEQQKQQKQQQASAQKKEGGGQNRQNAESRPLKPGQMTPEEAKRLLDAQKGDEQVLQFKPQQKPMDDLNPVKDW